MYIDKYAKFKLLLELTGDAGNPMALDAESNVWRLGSNRESNIFTGRMTINNSISFLFTHLVAHDVCIEASGRSDREVAD